MTIQTERLEALLARVQENRQQPRAMAVAAPAAAVSAAQQHQAPPPERRVEARPPESRTKPAATPLEMAFEAVSVNNASASVNNPSARAPIAGAAQAAPAQAASAVHHAPAQAAGAARGAPAQPASAAQAPRDGVVLVDPAPMQASRPIAQVVSKHPPSTASTFGELLRRSLSLRPR